MAHLLNSQSISLYPPQHPTIKGSRSTDLLAPATHQQHPCAQGSPPSLLSEKWGLVALDSWYQNLLVQPLATGAGRGQAPLLHLVHQRGQSSLQQLL